MPQRSPASRPARPWRMLPGLLVLLLAAGGRAEDEAPRVLRPTAAGVAVAGRVRLAAGAHALADTNDGGALRITQDGTVLDLRDAALVGAPEGTPPDAYRGVGIRVVGARDVTIRGGRIRGYRLGIQAVDAPGLTIEGVDVSETVRQRLGSTPAREDPADWLWPHENDAGEWESRYGGGIALTDCAEATVRGCRGRHGQNGLLLTRCARPRVYDNDFSFNSGWGIALYRTSGGTIANNCCDWCVRGYSHGVYHRGQDSAGILVFEQCHENAFVGNSATHSGDGFFLYAGHETTQRTGQGGCNRNVVYDNDFSYAVANGIEATFSLDNVFVRNRLDGCDHGIWAGYSSRTLIAGNTMTDCLTAGISIEHGQENRIVHNTIQGGPVGVHLWWDHDEAFVDGVYGRARDTASARNVLVGNDILADGVAVQLVGDVGTALRFNVLFAREALLHLGADTEPGPVEHNLFRGPRSAARPAPQLVRGAAAAAFALDPSNLRRGRLTASEGVDLDGLDEGLRLVRPPPRLPARPEVPGTGPRRLPEGMPRGRAQMRIGPWGPLDPREPAVVPVAVAGDGGGWWRHFDLLGRGRWRVVSMRGPVDVHVEREDGVLESAREGTLPARLVVGCSPLGGPGIPLCWRPSLVPFEVVLEVAGRRLVAAGTLERLAWDVHHFPWTQDPRTHPEAWRALVNGALSKRRQPPEGGPVRALDFAWRTGGPKGVPADRFGTVATSTLRIVRPGRYRIRTVSDDGIRVWVGERLVIDRWTHHAPTEDVAEAALEPGEHRLRVEHFELDGWAHLTLTVEPLP